MAALSGINPMLFAETTNELKVAYLSFIAERAIEIDEMRRKSQAQHIVNELGKALNKGSRQQQSGNATNTTA